MPRKDGRPYMDDYDSHDWADFMVREAKDKPKGPHFAAVLFETRSEWTPGYSASDGGSSSTVPSIVYFAFPDKETLGEWLLRASKESKRFFFFEVTKLGQAQLKVDLDLKM